MGLPRLDLPISLLTWEVSLPERLEVKQFGGNAISAEVFPPAAQSLINDEDDMEEADNRAWTRNDLGLLQPGQVGGIVVDPQGAVVSGATITVSTQSGASLSTTSDSEGHWMIAGIAPGPLTVRIAAPGFKDMVHELNYSGSHPARIGTTLEVGQVSATVTITDGASALESNSKRIEESIRKEQLTQQNRPSQNVFSLQRRVAGILPVRIEVPRSGKSYRFVRPLILEEETKISFQYKSK
jgi:hypothetical protein